MSVIVVLTASACSGAQTADTSGNTDASNNSPATDAPKTDPEDAPVTIRFATWDTASSLETYKAVVDGFQAKYPNIKVQVESVPDSYEQKIFTSLAAGNAPDVFLWWNYPQLVARGAVEPLDSYIQSGEIDPDQYYPEIFNASKVNGVLYSIPNIPTTRAIFYNKTLFDKAGVPYPKDDWTYDDFLSAAQKLTGDGVYGFVTEAKNTYTLQQFVWTNGGKFISEDGKTVDGIMNSPQTAEALQWYADLVNKYKVSPSPSASTTMGGGTEMFKTGKVAMFESGLWPLNDYRKMSNFSFGTAMMPRKNGKLVGILHTSGFVVSKTSKHKDAAFKFAQYMGSKEGQTNFVKLGFGLPEMPAIAQDLKTAEDPYFRPFLEMIKYATVTPSYYATPEWSKIDEKLVYAMEATILGKMTAQEALNNAVKEINTTLQVGK
ncbi:ABC transporter substrate-binding protein [Paenibacillus arenilitoris]|uniref:Sugar ABC transporter substrate-binding protein n=1 Tax=Paenibacillus arenilitoris TaxID=2772299 RepID=A0A927CVG8_9BACL|nr:sugar ABC transporter substrate-binding protein [Paenibacillus arenilitoris]MBD2872290.1 sugar ABC transporter substrate-binding protein [Paenibacillus arenilitoris]